MKESEESKKTYRPVLPLAALQSGLQNRKRPSGL
jgi:hypothetical protein